jgi:type IV pilus assembly protein PilM
VTAAAAPALLARGRRWIRRNLVDAERPLVAVEVRARAVGVLRLARDGRRLTLGAAASLDLPPGTLRLSMTEVNIVEGAAFRDVLRAALERAGALTATRVALVLPDPVARVAVLSGADVPARGRGADDLVRFKLRKSLPFDVRETQLAVAASGTRATDTVVVAAMFRPVLAAYEEGCRDLGLSPGLVQLAGLALLNATLEDLPSGDRLLVNWDDGYVTLLLARGQWPLLVRTLTGPPAEDPREVARELSNTLLYYRERLEGDRLEQAVLRSAALPAGEAVAILEESLGIRPVLVEPWRGLKAPEAGGVTQALAGAAACLVSGR